MAKIRPSPGNAELSPSVRVGSGGLTRRGAARTAHILAIKTIIRVSFDDTLPVPALTSRFALRRESVTLLSVPSDICFPCCCIGVRELSWRLACECSPVRGTPSAARGDAPHRTDSVGTILRAFLR